MSSTLSLTRKYVLLHLIILLFSFAGIFSKLAAMNEFLSVRFLFFYGLSLLVMFMYALLWQQVLKRIPLSIAYINCSAAVVWGIVWGLVFFGETLKLSTILGAVIVLTGVMLVVTDRE